jgi:TolB-like protein
MAALSCIPFPVHAADGRLAIMYFDNISRNPDLDALSVALSELLVVELSGNAPVRIVERQQLQKLLDELQFGHSGKVDPDTAADLGRLIGAGWMLLGSYFEFSGSLSITSRMVDVETGAILYATRAQGTTATFFDMVGKLAADHSADLKGRGSPAAPKPPASAPKPPAAPSQPASTTPPKPASTQNSRGSAYASAAPPPVRAALALSDGLVAMDRGDKATARVALNDAVALQPDMKAARSALAALTM